MKHLCVFCTLVVLLSGCVDSSQKNIAPDLNLRLYEGDSIRLSQLRGDFILLDFWATWCGPCLKEIPQLKELHRDMNGGLFGDKARFEILSVALERDQRRAIKYQQKEPLPWKYKTVEESRFVRFAEAARLYKVTEIPSSFLISPEGEILLSNPSIEEVRHFLTEVQKN